MACAEDGARIALSSRRGARLQKWRSRLRAVLTFLQNGVLASTRCTFSYTGEFMPLNDQGYFRVACAEDGARIALSSRRGARLQNGALACARCSLSLKSALSPRRGAFFVFTALIVLKLTSQGCPGAFKGPSGPSLGCLEASLDPLGASLKAPWASASVRSHLYVASKPITCVVGGRVGMYRSIWTGAWMHLSPPHPIPY